MSVISFGLLLIVAVAVIAVLVVIIRVAGSPAVNRRPRHDELRQICPKCGALPPEDAAFCSECGTPLLTE